MSGRIVVHEGKSFHVGGRKRRAARGPRLSLKNYLDLSKLPEAPDCDYSPTAQDFSDVLGNDSLGDCTCAGVGHIIDVVTGAAGAPAAITAQQVINLYSLSCGYKPGDPSTDQGGDEQSVLDFVCAKGIDGAGLHKFDASVLVDATDQEEVRAALWLFGNLYFGEALPDAYVNPFPNDGSTWDVAGPPVDSNGHCFIGYGSHDKGILINTWGRKVLHTYAALAKYAIPDAGGELHVVLTCDWINQASQKAPSGFGLQDLVSDLSAVGMIVPAAPPITPAIAAPTLQQVVQALSPLWPT